ncbi:hypothetical protein BJ138DRAFT_1141578 [Hygrophoropsis aurantiaca]|uniref:Uncharacterized protein n=1 Tax=Hygrophoropsis aurantiaca TaxID=72124 RepID=A0ACB8AQG8_9AGAM|nr:hypothetical protein BJ138DRAFT_1141578 [Hygrophoropsis aurantiaca]
MDDESQASASSTTQPVKQTLLFGPSIPGEYTLEDRLRFFTEVQPSKKIPTYLLPDPKSKVIPPLLHYGCIVDVDRCTNGPKKTTTSSGTTTRRIT